MALFRCQWRTFNVLSCGIVVSLSLTFAFLCLFHFPRAPTVVRFNAEPEARAICADEGGRFFDNSSFAVEGVSPVADQELGLFTRQESWRTCVLSLASPGVPPPLVILERVGDLLFVDKSDVEDSRIPEAPDGTRVPIARTVALCSDAEAITMKPCRLRNWSMQRLTVRFLHYLAATSGSTVMRAMMMSDVVQKAQPSWDVRAVDVNKFLAGETRYANLLVDICVCVKFCPQIMVDECRHRGATVLWDVLDAELVETNATMRDELSVSRLYFPESMEGVPDVDVAVANNLFHAGTLLRRGVKRAVSVFHQHSYAPSWVRSGDVKRASNLSHPVQQAFKGALTVTYIGSKRNTLPDDVHDALNASVSEAGMNFVTINYNKNEWLDECLADQAAHPDPADPYKQRCHHELVNGTDFGLLWPVDRGFHTIRLRPVTRLLYWWSHGVPTVYYPYESYTEAVASHAPEFKVLEARTPAQVADRLRLLRRNPALVSRLKRVAENAAAAFSTDMVGRRLASVFCALET